MVNQSTYRNILLALIRQPRPSSASVTNLLASDALGSWIKAWQLSKHVSQREFEIFDHLVGRVVNSSVQLVYARSREHWESLTSLNALSVPNQDRKHISLTTGELHSINFDDWTNAPSRSYSIHGTLFELSSSIKVLCEFLRVVNSHVLIEVRDH